MTASTFGATMSSRETSGSGHEPVLVAMKPYEGFDSALAMASGSPPSTADHCTPSRSLEPHDTLAIAAGVPVLAERYHAEERAAIAELLERAARRVGRRTRTRAARGRAGRAGGAIDRRPRA